MKKLFALVALLSFILCSCATIIKTEYVSLVDIPDTYTLEDAKEDGCVTFENGDITEGQARWDAFASVVPEQKATVRLAYYYTLDDPSRYSEEYYESVKDDYPQLFVMDLSYDGEAYTLTWYEEGQEIVRSYPHMVRFEGEAETPHATYDRYVRYVLVNDKDVTWEELQWGMLSSQMGDYIPHNVVYTDLQ